MRYPQLNNRTFVTVWFEETSYRTLDCKCTSVNSLLIIRATHVHCTFICNAFPVRYGLPVISRNDFHINPSARCDLPRFVIFRGLHILTPCICGLTTDYAATRCSVHLLYVQHKYSPRLLRDVLCIPESARTVLHKVGDGCPHDPTASSLLLLLPPTWQEILMWLVLRIRICRSQASVPAFVISFSLSFTARWTGLLPTKCAIQDDRPPGCGRSCTCGQLAGAPRSGICKSHAR